LIDIPPSSIRYTDSIRTGIGPRLAVPCLPSPEIVPFPSDCDRVSLPLRRYTQRYLITGLVTKKYSTAIASHSLQRSLGWQWLSFSTQLPLVVPHYSRAHLYCILHELHERAIVIVILFPRPRLSTLGSSQLCSRRNIHYLARTEPKVLCVPVEIGPWSRTELDWTAPCIFPLLSPAHPAHPSHPLNLSVSSHFKPSVQFNSIISTLSFFSSFPSH
jgi:hypothetical protein